MYKKHLQTVERKQYSENKNEYGYVLTQNERNYSLPKKLWKKFLDSINETDIFFYPNLDRLKYKLSLQHKVKSDNILLTHGSDTGINTIIAALDLKGKKVISTDPCFPMYKVYCELNNVIFEQIKYTSSVFNLATLVSYINKNTGLVIIANPNSPLGDCYTINELKKLLDTKVPVLVDEAYIELSGIESCSNLCTIYPNLFILRTFSKGFGAAGCRVGYIISRSENIQNLSKLKPMYEISGLSSKYIEFILDNFKIYKKYLKNTLRHKSKLVSKLKKLYTIVDTQSSWFFIESSPTVDEILKYNNVAYRKVVLPGSKEEWIKFNYDLKIKNSKLEKMLENGSRK